MLGDLHVHSCLSPCADITMTPRGILENLEVGMISITDHNCCGNARTFWKVCRERKVIFLPGIEISSIEEVHILGYFENLEDLERVSSLSKGRGRIWEKCLFPHWIVTYFCRSTKMCYTYKRGEREGRRKKEEGRREKREERERV